MLARTDSRARALVLFLLVAGSFACIQVMGEAIAAAEESRSSPLPSPNTRSQ